MYEAFCLDTSEKTEFPPAHTAEHLLSQTMDKMFECGHPVDVCIEGKKASASYTIGHKPNKREEKEIERRINNLINEDLPITCCVNGKERMVSIGEYDTRPCIGKHVRSTAQIGRFEILNTKWNEKLHTLTIRFKVVQ